MLPVGGHAPMLGTNTAQMTVPCAQRERTNPSVVQPVGMMSAIQPMYSPYAQNGIPIAAPQVLYTPHPAPGGQYPRFQPMGVHAEQRPEAVFYGAAPAAVLAAPLEGHPPPPPQQRNGGEGVDLPPYVRQILRGNKRLSKTLRGLLAEREYFRDELDDVDEDIQEVLSQRVCEYGDSDSDDESDEGGGVGADEEEGHKAKPSKSDTEQLVESLEPDKAHELLRGRVGRWRTINPRKPKSRPKPPTKPPTTRKPKPPGSRWNRPRRYRRQNASENIKVPGTRRARAAKYGKGFAKWAIARGVNVGEGVTSGYILNQILDRTAPRRGGDDSVEAFNTEGEALQAARTDAGVSGEGIAVEFRGGAEANIYLKGSAGKCLIIEARMETSGDVRGYVCVRPGLLSEEFSDDEAFASFGRALKTNGMAYIGITTDYDTVPSGCDLMYQFK